MSFSPLRDLEQSRQVWFGHLPLPTELKFLPVKEKRGWNRLAGT
jgi:hypothetical protein